jgi:hypothetical protein
MVPRDPSSVQKDSRTEFERTRQERIQFLGRQATHRSMSSPGRSFESAVELPWPE